MLWSSGKGHYPLVGLEQATQHTLGFESDCLRKYPTASEPAADLGLELSPARCHPHAAARRPTLRPRG